MGVVREPRHGGVQEAAAAPGGAGFLSVIEALPIEEALTVAGGSSLAALAEGAAGAATPRLPGGRNAGVADDSSPAAYPRVDLGAGPAYFSPVESARRAAAELAATRVAGGVSCGGCCSGAPFLRRLRSPQFAGMPGWDQAGDGDSGDATDRGAAPPERSILGSRRGAQLVPTPSSPD
jgi:hypothetical protein